MFKQWARSEAKRNETKRLSSCNDAASRTVWLEEPVSERLRRPVIRNEGPACPSRHAARRGNEEMTKAAPAPAFRVSIPSFLPGMTRAGGNEGIEGWIREDWRLRAFRPLGGLGRIASWRLARSWSPGWTFEHCLGRHHEANGQGRPHYQSAARWRRFDGENDNGQGRAGQGGATRAAVSRPAVLIQARLEIVVDEIMAPGDYRRLDWEPRLTLDVDARILPRPVSRM